MTDKNVAEMIQQCIDEITSLRGQLAMLRPKAEAYDAITQVLGLLPQPPQGYGVDFVWQLRNQLEELQPKPEVASAEA